MSDLVATGELRNEQARAFREFSDTVTEVNDLLQLSKHGIRMVAASDRLAEALANLESSLQDAPASEEQAKKVDSARRQASRARSEVERGFPLLQGQAVILTWGAVEALVEDICLARLKANPGIMAADSFPRVRVNASVLAHPDPSEWFRAIVESLQRDLGPRSAMGRSLALMSAVELRGNIDPRVRRTLDEMAQVRHVLVHRRGVVDAAFVKACPWLDASPGTTLQVSERDFERYRRSVEHFAVELINRVLEEAEQETMALPAPADWEADLGLRGSKAY